MPKELAKQYAPQGTEDRIYQNWCDKGYFHTQIDRSKKPFTIVMPPPNITGQLHMGHAMDETCRTSSSATSACRATPPCGCPAPTTPPSPPRPRSWQAMREGGPDQGDARPRRLPGARLGVEGRRTAAASCSQLQKLGCSCDWEPRALHHGRGLLQRGAGSVRPPVRQGPDLPGQPHGQLVPPLQDLHLRRRGGVRGAGRPLLAPAATR